MAGSVEREPAEIGIAERMREIERKIEALRREMRELRTVVELQRKAAAMAQKREV